MNFLAHLYLCDGSDEALLGSLYGDFLKGYRVTDFSSGIQRGIQLHKRIDAFTDDHPIFRRSKRRIAVERRRYSGVLIDIFYDHFLAKSWRQYASIPLNTFALNVYRLLEQYADQLPGRLSHIAPILIQENWLMAYADLTELELILERVSRRISRQNTVDQGLDDLRRHYDAFSQDFCYFFPELQKYVLYDPCK